MGTRFCGPLDVRGEPHEGSHGRATIDIQSEQRAIRAASEANAPHYAATPSVKRKRILAGQDRLVVRIDSKASLGELNSDRRPEAIGLMREIWAAVSDRESARLVCTCQVTTAA